MKRKLRCFFIFVSMVVAYTFYLYAHDETALPPLQDGDIIFQTTWTDQSMAIGLATLSLFIHTGLIKKGPDGFLVVEAANPVRETPLVSWIHGGILQRFTVYRYQNLTPVQTARIAKAASSYDGEPYNFYFSFEKGTMYCSELIYMAYKDAGIPIGKVQRIGSMHLDNRFVKEIIEKRWKNYPACRNKVNNFEQCYRRIMNGQIITPASIAHDSHLVRIFDNYPW